MSISAHCGSCDRKLVLGLLTEPRDGFRCPFCGFAFAPGYASVTPRLTGQVIAAQAALVSALTELRSMTEGRLQLDQATMLDPIAATLAQSGEADPARGRRTRWWGRQGAEQPALRSSTAGPS